MSPSSPLRLALALLFSLCLLPISATGGGDHEGEIESLPFSSLSFPEPEKHFSATQKCVAPEEEMRKNHMEYILHQRDETVHEGVRTRQYALEECINCHATKDEQGNYLPVNGPDQFCSSCHSYTSVSIDCFQCHATKPARASTLKSSRIPPDHGTEAQRLAAEGQAQ